MIRSNTRKSIALALVMMGTMAAASLTASGQQPSDPVASPSPDPKEAVVTMLNGILEVVNVETVESMPESEIALAAQTVVQALQGPDDEETDVAGGDAGQGAIPLLEALARVDAADIADPEAVLAADAASGEIIALAHVLVANHKLTGETVDRSVLLQAVGHIEQAREALS